MLMTNLQHENVSDGNLNKKLRQTNLAAWLLTLAGLFIIAETVYSRIKTDEFSIAILAPGLICLLVGASKFRKIRKIREELDRLKK